MVILQLPHVLLSVQLGPFTLVSCFIFFNLASGQFSKNTQSLLTGEQKVNVAVRLAILLGHFPWKRLIECSQPLLHVNSSTVDINQAQPTAPTQSLEVQSVPSK